MRDDYEHQGMRDDHLLLIPSPMILWGLARMSWVTQNHLRNTHDDDHLASKNKNKNHLPHERSSSSWSTAPFQLMKCDDVSDPHVVSPSIHFRRRFLSFPSPPLISWSSDMSWWWWFKKSPSIIWGLFFYCILSPLHLSSWLNDSSDDHLLKMMTRVQQTKSNDDLLKRHLLLLSSYSWLHCLQSSRNTDSSQFIFWTIHSVL